MLIVHDLNHIEFQICFQFTFALQIIIHEICKILKQLVFNSDL